MKERYNHLTGATESYIEEKMYGALQRWDISFRTQVWVGSFRVDFLLEDDRFLNSKLVIECDGAAFHLDAQKEKRRDEYLEKNGFVVVHVGGSEIMKNPYDCVGNILERYWPEVGNEDKRWLELHQKWREWFESKYPISELEEDDDDNHGGDLI